jgi:hypothetical protein
MCFTSLILYELHQQRLWHVSCVLDNPLTEAPPKINSVEMQGSQENSVDNFFPVKNASGLNFWL